MRKDCLIINVFLVSFIAGFVSCRKETKIISQNPVATFSRISITNASPAISNLKYYLNDTIVSLPDSPLSYGSTAFATYINANQYGPDTSTIPYIDIPSGYQQLAFGSYGSSDIFSIVNNNFKPGGSYSLFITDTISHGQLTTVLIPDYIGTTDSTKGQIRFINLSPDSPPLDLWAFPNVGAVGYKIFSNCAYLPNDYNSFINAESFSFIKAGPYYLEATVAGTNNVVLEGGFIIPGQDVVTIYTAGYYAGIGTNSITTGVIEFKQP